MAVHGKSTRVLVDKYNLTRIFNEWSKSGTKDEAESTAFGAEDKEFEAGHRATTVSLNGNFETGLVVDPGPTPTLRPDDVLNAAFDTDGSKLLAVAQEGFGFGKRAFLFEGEHLGYDNTAPIGDIVKITANFSGRAKARYGLSLHDILAGEAASGNSAGIDNGAASTDGGIGQLHVPINSRNGIVTVKIQHSTDGSTWVDLITFTDVSAATLAAQRLEVTGTVNRHIRALWTVAGTTGDTTFAVAFARL